MSPAARGPLSRYRQLSKSRAGTLAGTAAMSALIMCAAQPLAAMAAPTTPPAAVGSSASHSLALSAPPTPIPVIPGIPSTVTIRLINPAATPVSATLTDQLAELGDNGSVRLLNEQDPRWVGRIALPPHPVTLPPRSFLPITIHIAVPATIEPDLYFIGVVATPVATGNGSVHIISRVGALITLDVPGPRRRILHAAVHAGLFQLASTAHATLQVSNPGFAAVRFFGEENAPATPGEAPSPTRIQPAILPVGRHRAYQVTSTSSWPIAFVTMKVRLSYPDRTDTATKDVFASRRILLVKPWVPILAAAVLLAAAALLLNLRQRRRKRGNSS